MKKIQNKITMVATTLIITFPQIVYAAVGDDVLAPVNRFVDFLLSAIRIVGVAVLAFNLFQFFSALRTHDPSQRDSAILGIVSGVGIIFIPDLITWLIG